MARILLIKTSSLGDLVHNLPVVRDILRHRPSTRIDWVAEAAFAPIAHMHAGVSRVLPVEIRRWRRSFFNAATRDACRAFLRQLREREYDAIIDTQGLLKSALVARTARGTRHGLDWSSSREPLRCFYDHTYRVPWGQHAVTRNRSLAAQALGYALAGTADYGIASTPHKAGPQRPAFDGLPSGNYAVLLHATSASTKLWPESHWIELSNYLILNNIISILPWGNASERERSERLATKMKHAIVPPALSLPVLAEAFRHAKAVIGVDTGLTHLAAALHTPTVGIYCATDPAATGIHECPRAANLGGIGTPPPAAEVIAALERLMFH